MLWNYILYCDITLCSCRCHHEGSGLYLVRNNSVLSTMKLLNTLDPDNISSGALDIGTHAVKEVCKVYYVWLFGCILDNSLALSHCCCHHDIDSCANTYNIQVNVTSDQLVCVSINDAMLNAYLCPKSCEPLDMLVDRSKTDVTAAWKYNSCFFVLTKKSTKQIVRSTYLFNVVLYSKCVDL